MMVLARGSSRDAMAESLPPSASKLLARVGMLGAVEQGSFVRSTGNCVRWASGETRQEYFGRGVAGWQLRRDVFDQALLASARQAGVTVVHDVSARDVSIPSGDGTREVVYESDGGRRTVRARWILDCTGRTGIVARRGWRTPESAARTLAIVGVWTREGPWGLMDDTHTVVESYDDGWAWSIPVSRSIRYVTVMVDPAYTSIGSGAALAATYSAALARTTAIRELVERATPTGMPWARESSPYGFSSAGENGMLLVGDAASFVDPLSSFGIKKALASAWLAAVTVHAALRDSAIVSPAIELYGLREREMHTELQRQAVTLARDAALPHGSQFWGDRTGSVISADSREDGGLVSATRATRAAFEEIRTRPRIALQYARTLAYVPKAIVTGDDITVLPHLVTSATPRGIRFVRNVDVVQLCELAPGFDQVPDLYDAYNRRTNSTVALSDFLAALATLVGVGALHSLDSPLPGL